MAHISPLKRIQINEMPTIYEVSKLAGVSLATVSRVINKSSSVTEKTRLKVEKAVQQLGYKPNSVAQSLASNRSNCVGVLVGDLYSSYYGSLMDGIEKELRSANKHIVIGSSHGDEQQEKDDIEFLIDRKCDALILHVEAVSDEYLQNLSNGTTPIFLVNRIVPTLDNNSIDLDNEQGGYLATKYAIDSGHTEIAYLSGPSGKKDVQARLAGHKRALNECGIPFRDTLVYEGDYLQSGGREGINHFLNNNQPFTALVCANDEMAIGAMATARDKAIHIPDDLSIIGFDNVIFSSYVHPKLTTINNPIREIGRMAACLVLKRVYAEETPEINHLFRPTLISRESVAEPRKNT